MHCGAREPAGARSIEAFMQPNWILVVAERTQRPAGEPRSRGPAHIHGRARPWNASRRITRMGEGRGVGVDGNSPHEGNCGAGTVLEVEGTACAKALSRGPPAAPLLSEGPDGTGWAGPGPPQHDLGREAGLL